MSEQKPNPDNNRYVNIAIDIILKVGSLALMAYICVRILQPFLSMLLWGLIIAIILYPLFHKLRILLGNRHRLSSMLVTLVTLSLLVLPSIWLVNQLVDGIRFLTEFVQDGTVYVPPPNERVGDWPLIGPWLYENWLSLSQNLGETLKGFLPQIAKWSERIMGALANTGMGVLQFAASIIIAGILLIFFEKGSDTGRKVFVKLVGERGEEFQEVALHTIRNVAMGVLGVAIIQTTLMGVGLIIAGIPLAAVWIVILLVMTVAQIPALLFNIPLIIYLFSSMDALPAVLWTLYFLVMGFIDNPLKALIYGKSGDVPMLVIFLGALGGFMAFGFMGLFLGAIVISLAYKVYVTWISTVE